MIEMYLLEQLAAVARYATLSDAAEALHLTQPALTKSMKKMEQTIGFPLFIREHKKITLNEAGLLAAEYANQILQLHDKMIAHVSEVDRRNHAISIASLAPMPLIILQQRLLLRYPELSIHADLIGEEELLQNLDNHRYQLMISNKPIAVDDYICTFLFSEQLSLSVRAGDSLSTHKTIKWEDIDGLSLIIDKSSASATKSRHQRIRDFLPHSQFIEASSRTDLEMILNSSVLPGISTNLTPLVYHVPEHRLLIPIDETDAKRDYYVICQRSDYKRFADVLNDVQ